MRCSEMKRKDGWSLSSFCIWLIKEGLIYIEKQVVLDSKLAFGNKQDK